MKCWSIIIFLVLMLGCTKPHEGFKLEWTKPVNLPSANKLQNIGIAGPMVAFFGDTLMLAGGANFPNGMPWEAGKKAYQKDAYLYSFRNAQLELIKQFNLENGIAYAANFTDEDAYYTAGGENELGVQNQVSKYNFSQHANLIKTSLPALPIPLTNAGLTGNTHHLFLVGGENENAVSDKVYALDLADTTNKGWTELITLPYPISNAIVVSDSKSKIYVIGGRKRNLHARSDIYDSILEIETAGQPTIKNIAKLPKAIAAGTGLYYKGKLLIFGGDDAGTFHQVEDALGKIAVENDPQIKVSLIQSKNKLQINHPGFSKENWAYDISTGTWAALAGMQHLSPVTTTAILKDNYVIIPSGEVKAGVRTDQILIGKLINSETNK